MAGHPLHLMASSLIARLQSLIYRMNMWVLKLVYAYSKLTLTCRIITLSLTKIVSILRISRLDGLLILTSTTTRREDTAYTLLMVLLSLIFDPELVAREVTSAWHHEKGTIGTGWSFLLKFASIGWCYISRTYWGTVILFYGTYIWCSGLDWLRLSRFE